MALINRLAKNSALLLASEGTAALLTLLGGLLIARRLPLVEFGRFTTAFALASVLAVFIDCGMGMLAAKELARGRESAFNLLDEFFSWRLAVTAAAGLVTPLLAWIFLPGAGRWTAAALAPGVFLIAFSDFFAWLLKGAQKVSWCAFLQVSTNALLFTLVCVALFLNQAPMRFLVIAYAVTGLAANVVGLGLLARLIHPLHLRWPSRAFFNRTIPGLYKLGVTLILSVAFTRVDLLLVARLCGSAQAGLYAAAGHAIDAIRLIPLAVYSVVLPTFSAAQDQPLVLRQQFKAAYGSLLLLSLFIALLGSAYAEPIFTRLLGAAYGPAAICFKPLAWSCVLMFSNILMFALLVALGDQRTPLKAIVGALTLEVLLDLAWLPRYGMLGAAWARIAAEFMNGAVLATGLLRRRVLSWRVLCLVDFTWERERKAA